MRFLRYLRRNWYIRAQWVQFDELQVVFTGPTFYWIAREAARQCPAIINGYYTTWSVSYGEGRDTVTEKLHRIAA